MESGYYPPGAEVDSNAPYNQVDLPEREIEVTVSVTLSKTVKIYVNDYDVEVDVDEDGMYETYDFSNCDLHQAVEDQITLPQDLSGVVESVFKKNSKLKEAGIPRNLKDALEDTKDWCVDEMEVVLE